MSAPTPPNAKLYATTHRLAVALRRPSSAANQNGAGATDKKRVATCTCIATSAADAIRK
jgi:hypothetical protein